MLAIYKENYQQEKVHIHFDKGLYAKGETIWGKAYILAGEGLSDYSRNFTQIGTMMQDNLLSILYTLFLNPLQNFNLKFRKIIKAPAFV